MRRLSPYSIRVLPLVFLFCWLQPAFAVPSSKDLIEIPIAEAPSYSKIALIIGVENYELARPLNSTVNDAKAFRDFLINKMRFPAEAITLMTDEAGAPENEYPTQNRLRHAMNGLLDRMDENSEVIFYYSGHGARMNDQDWLVPKDGDPRDIAASCINYDHFKQQLETKRPHRALLIADACRNLHEAKGDDPSGFGQSQATLDPQIAEIVSCLPKEVSWEGEPGDFQQGVFTHFLLKGLGGAPEASTADGKVTFDSLKRYVHGKVSQYVWNAHREPQNPTGKASLGEMMLARSTGSANILPAGTIAHLKITTEPAGAEVLVDGQDQGKATPCTLDFDLAAAKSKQVEIGLELRGYAPLKRAITLTPGATFPLDMPLQQEEPRPIPPPLIPFKHKTNPIDNAEMVYVPAGPFPMGSTKTEGFNNEWPQHQVTLDAYWIYQNPVTVAQFRKFCTVTARTMPLQPNVAKDDHPVVYVSWEDAKAYCDWAGMALPTEAQWEKGARGTDGRTYPWGNDWDASKLWWNQITGTTSVGSFPAGASPYGCLDMAGNVCQWCADWSDDNYYQNSPAANPLGPPTGEKRVTRGGAWGGSGQINFRCAFRSSNYPAFSSSLIGFRCVSRP